MPGLELEEETQKLAQGAFGESITSMNEPVVQFQFVYFLPERSFSLESQGATVTRNTQSEVCVATGTTQGGLSDKSGGLFRSTNQRARLWGA